MAEGPFAPFDQYQPFVDVNGRITSEWYSWLSQLCDELNRLAALEVEARRPKGPQGPPYDYGGIDG
jgi:hypothetical protein